MEVAERGRKAAENEIMDVNDCKNELSARVQFVSSHKRILGSDIPAMQGDLVSGEIKSADDRAKKVISDAAYLAEELRSEQRHTQQVENMRKVLESQMREMSVCLDVAESQAPKGGKKAIAKLEK